jgi:hypothetical protein
MRLGLCGATLQPCANASTIKGELMTSASFFARLLALTGAAMAATSAFAAPGGPVPSPPTVTITAPTSANIVYSASFPFVQAVGFTVTHPTVSIDALNVLDVLVNSSSILGTAVGNPFSETACEANMTTLGRTCSVVTNVATASVPWTVVAPGSYTILVSVKYKGDTGSDEETVQVVQLSAEYPAPPAVANAYINSDAYLKSLSGKRRGCIISQIAEQHAKYSMYGPKGGPYDNAAIKAAAASFASSCN